MAWCTLYVCTMGVTVYGTPVIHTTGPLVTGTVVVPVNCT